MTELLFPPPSELWAWMPKGYLFTIAIETPVLLLLLSRAHHWPRRLAAGGWLTACSYPVVVVALPLLLGLEPRWRYLAVAETFAPLSECVLFALAFHTAETRRADRWRDFAAITAANLASFLLGEWLQGQGERGWPEWLWGG
jgi:hypothetical protein